MGENKSAAFGGLKKTRTFRRLRRALVIFGIDVAEFQSDSKNK